MFDFRASLVKSEFNNRPPYTSPSTASNTTLNKRTNTIVHVAYSANNRIMNDEYDSFPLDGGGGGSVECGDISSISPFLFEALALLKHINTST